MNDVTILGQTDWRNQQTLFGIRDADRLGHLYAVGKTGVGKSTLLLNLAIQDLQREKGFTLIDPHGDLAEGLLAYLPPERAAGTFYLNAAAAPPCFNPLLVPLVQRDRATAALVSSFKKIWKESWGPRLEYILRYALRTLMDYPGATLLDVQPLLTDGRFREEVLRFVNDLSLRRFWLTEFDRYPAGLRTEAVSSILNKTGIFQQSPLREIVGDRRGSLSFSDLMARGDVLIANLCKGLIGEESASILGSLLIGSLQQAATARAALPAADRTPYYLYVDEMHSFVTQSFAGILSECRKFGLGVFLAHQYLDQMDEQVRAAVFGNVGTLICFQVGAEDAIHLARELAPVFSENDLVNLPRHGIYLKLLIDGVVSKPFSARAVSLPPPPPAVGKPTRFAPEPAGPELPFAKTTNGFSGRQTNKELNKAEQGRLFD